MNIDITTTDETTITNQQQTDYEVDQELEAMMKAEEEGEGKGEGEEGNDIEQVESDVTTTTDREVETTTTKTNEPTKTNEQLLAELATMTAEQIIEGVGGKDRGAISKAIRFLIALGATKGQTAKMLNKRFQHVRNVLHNDMIAKQNGKTIPLATPSAPVPMVSRNHHQDEILDDDAASQAA